jgi:hypothetical protein
MAKAGVLLALFAVLAAGQSSAPAGAPPAEVPSGVAATLSQDGIKITDGSKLIGEFWFVASPASREGSAEDGVTIPTLPVGALLGVARLPARFADRLGTQLKGGVYTLRYAAYPADGAHQGVEPQRDFLILSPVDADKAGKEGLEFAALMDLSRKATGTSHPAVLSMWRVDADFKAGLSKAEAGDVVLQVKVGDLPVAVIVQGKTGH